MAIKVLIQRKIKPGKDIELNAAVRELRVKAIHAPGYISGETLRSIEDPSMHLVISNWKSLEDWNNWLTSPERKEIQQQIDAMLDEPTKSTPYEHEPVAVEVSEILRQVEYSTESE